jgi:hypothetical protein
MGPFDHALKKHGRLSIYDWIEFRHGTLCPYNACVQLAILTMPL